MTGFSLVGRRTLPKPEAFVSNNPRWAETKTGVLAVPRKAPDGGRAIGFDDTGRAGDPLDGVVDASCVGAFGRLPFWARLFVVFPFP